MSAAVRHAEVAVLALDEQDALRVVEAVVTFAAMPGIISPEAREIAIVRLRGLAIHHPRMAEIFAAVVDHLESYQ